MARRQKRSLLLCRFGFTLLELIIALAIVSILAGIAIPTWSTLIPTYSLNVAARQVQSELHKTKSRAVAENTHFRIVFSTGSYKIQKDNGLSYKDTGEDKPLPEGITLGSSSVTILNFTSRGTSTGGTIRLCNSRGAGKNIVVLSSTGRTRVCPMAGNPSLSCDGTC
jgi:prepilin-type N-terminal cleavage/methylation domain-containing protein